MPENFKNFIAGEWVAPRTGAYFENRNPADWEDVIGGCPRPCRDGRARAVASAKRGCAQWSRRPAPSRGEVLHRVGDLLVQRKELIARALTRDPSAGSNRSRPPSPPGCGSRSTRRSG